jgi:hypothetical protein
MFVKEEEAKTKYCPLTFSSPHSPKMCSGRTCMAWRPSVMNPGGEVWVFRSERERDKMFEINPLGDAVKGGVCGLSGGRMT